MLEEAGLGPVALVPEGIDPTAFHPGPTSGSCAGRFVVFSGGKLEYRKDQDLVLKAFRSFAERHADALLVTAWNSPRPNIARDLDAKSTLAPVTFVETLEAVRRDSEERLARAKRAAEFMLTRTWSITTRRRAEVIAPYL